jgi:tetratricopeptide (TPR) repeat protein
VTLALLSKSTAIAAGAMWVLTDWLHTGRWQESLRKLWGVLVVSGLYLAMIWRNGFLPHSLSRQVIPMADRLLTQAKAPVHYLQTLVMPIGLSPEPAFSLTTHASAAVVGSMAMTISMVCVAFVLCRRRLRGPWALVLWLGFTLVPVSLAPLNVLVNDRRLYLPLAGAAIAFACTGALVKRRFWRHTLAVSGLAILAAMSIERSQVWATDIQLWADAAAKGPMMPRAQLYLGDALLGEQGAVALQSRAARAAYEKVLSLVPEQNLLAFQATNGLALVDRAQGLTQQELQRLQGLVALAPGYADAWVNLGNAWYSTALTGDRTALPKALHAYERALQLHPDQAEAYLGRGAVLQVTGHLDEADVAYRSSLRLTSPASQAAMNLAGLYMLRARLATDSEQQIELLRSGRAVFVAAAAAGNTVAAGGIRAIDDSLAVTAERQR